MLHYFKTPLQALSLAGSPLPRDKDMSDNKAIKKTIRVFLVEEFCISPGEADQLPFA